MRQYSAIAAILFFLTIMAVQARAEAPVPQGAGRDELIANELQKATKWAQQESEEQTQESFQAIQDEVSGDLDDVKKKFESDKTLGDMSDEHLQDKAPIDDGNKVSQEIKQKFEADNKAEMESGKNEDYRGFTDDDAEKYKLADPSWDERNKKTNQFELATEAYSYKYTERIGVKDTGIKGGLVGAYQYRFDNNESIDSWSDLLHAGSKINIFRLEGRASYGKVDYEGSGTWGGIPDWNLEGRGLVGLEIPVRHRFLFTPYGGIGYRYLYNDFSKYPSSDVGGTQYLSGYDRESTYIYIPLGLQAETKLTRKWSVAVKGEVDFFVWGKQISHLEDSVDENDVSAGIDKLENTQKHGIGWRTSARLTREAGRIDVYIEPFIRYWHIEDSEVSLITASGSPICQGSLCSAGLEPDNKTWEYGVNLGAKF